MTDTTSPVSRIMTDGEPHPLTADTLDAMKTFLAAMAADKEVHAFVRDDVRSNSPALGYQLMVGSFEPSRYRNELVVVAEDSHAEADPQDQVYYDTFGAADGWTYMVRAGTPFCGR